MKIFKLINRLQYFPPGAKIKLLDLDGFEFDVDEKDIYKDPTDNVVYIDVKSIMEGK